MDTSMNRRSGSGRVAFAGSTEEGVNVGVSAAHTVSESSNPTARRIEEPLMHL
jgi:hypothetical protein